VCLAEFDEVALEAVNPAVLETLNAFLLQHNATQGIEATILNRRNKLPKTRNPPDRAFRSNSLGFGFSGSGFLVSVHDYDACRSGEKSVHAVAPCSWNDSCMLTISILSAWAGLSTACIHGAADLA
jgi:hypothetical protein